MCSVVAGVAIAGLLLSGYGMRQQAIASKRQGEAQAEINEAQAQDAEERGRKDEQRARLRTRSLSAQQEVGFATDGVNLAGRNVENVLGGTALAGEMDAETIQRNAANAAWGFRSAGAYATYTGAARGAAYNAEAGATLLAAAGRGAEGYQDWKNG